ncbi:MAG TPA: LysR family transcriptional regulator [Rhizomicrobium sp.]|nr:LysR family transcriptional regulator [Rhizomicrobium sp.]
MRFTQQPLLDASARLGQSAAMARLSIRIYLDEHRHALGPGMMELLEGVAEHGSIRKSAAAMGMSYRKAWLLIRNMQESFGGEIVTTTIGGNAGGGARLTALGKTLLASYRRIESGAARAAQAEIKTLLALAKRRGKTK